MLKKVKFYEPRCGDCPSYSIQGAFPSETRYCMARGRKGRRFKSTDPKFRVPKWCPRRLPSRVCRVFRLKEETRTLEYLRRSNTDPKKLTYYSVLGFRYDPDTKFERTIGYTVRQFYERVNRGSPEDILDDFGLEYGDLFEVDDGLKPFYFYYFGPGIVLPAIVSGKIGQKNTGVSV